MQEYCGDILNFKTYSRVDFLEQVILGEIKRLTKFASHYEDDFVKAVMAAPRKAWSLTAGSNKKNLPLYKPVIKYWMNCLSVSMRIMFPASSATTALPKCPAGTNRSRRRQRS